RLGRHLQHPASVEPHPIVLDLHPGPTQEVARVRVEEVDADLLEDGHRLAVDRRHVLRGEDVVGLEAVLPHGESNSAPPSAAHASAGTRTLRGGGCSPSAGPGGARPAPGFEVTADLVT